MLITWYFRADPKVGHKVIPNLAKPLTKASWQGPGGSAISFTAFPSSSEYVKSIPYVMRHGTIAHARRILHVVHIIDANTDTKNDGELEGTRGSNQRYPDWEITTLNLPLGYLSLDVIYHCIELGRVNSASTSSDLVENQGIFKVVKSFPSRLISYQVINCVR